MPFDAFEALGMRTTKATPKYRNNLMRAIKYKKRPLTEKRYWMCCLRRAMSLNTRNTSKINDSKVKMPKKLTVTIATSGKCFHSDADDVRRCFIVYLTLYSEYWPLDTLKKRFYRILENRTEIKYFENTSTLYTKLSKKRCSMTWHLIHNT